MTLRCDKGIIDRIIERCARGGVDNVNGCRFDETLARNLFASQSEVLTDSDKARMYAYLEYRIAQEQAEDE